MNHENHKQQLETELITLTEELKTLGIHNPAVEADWIATPAVNSSSEADENVAADKVEDWDERRATLALLETRYNNLKRALHKIDNNTYGLCEVCTEPITEARLKANPAARTCQMHLDEEGNLNSE